MRKYFFIDDLYEYLDKQKNISIRELNEMKRRCQSAFSINEEMSWHEGKLDLIESIKSFIEE